MLEVMKDGLKLGGLLMRLGLTLLKLRRIEARRRALHEGLAALA